MYNIYILCNFMYMYACNMHMINTHENEESAYVWKEVENGFLSVLSNF